MSDAEIDALAVPLRAEYRRFLGGRGGEVLLTGHSHQAWPDVAALGQREAWDDAARLVDAKWGRVLGEVLPDFRARVAARLGTPRADDLAVAPNTHELVARLLSCLSDRPSVLTTDAEFHSLSRQLQRLEEDGARVRRLDAEAPDLVARALEALEAEPPELLALSLVLFTTARILDGLPALLARAAELGVPVLVDTYHAFNALPLEVEAWPGEVFVVGGGYKYAQCGEGNCWMLIPAAAERFRPRHTGWFASFETLEDPGPTVAYGAGGARFMGATFDPTPFYRARQVLRWMDERGLDPERLRAQSRLQTAGLVARYDALALAREGLELASPRAPDRRGAFVSFRHPRAGALCHALAERGVRSDARRDLLRLGPAPYTTAAELDRGMQALSELLPGLGD